MQEVLIFEPPELVDEIVGDVVQSPGALPLLSYALSELYEAYRASGREDRALRKTDYDGLGGVMGALRSKADTLYQFAAGGRAGDDAKDHAAHGLGGRRPGRPARADGGDLDYSPTRIRACRS